MLDSHVQIGSFSRRSKQIALVAGPLLATLVYFLLPDSYMSPAGDSVAFTHAGKACLSVVLWMAIWWFSDTIPIAATAMLPLVLFPILGVATVAQTTTPYASDTIFLFLGGFLLAAGIQRWHLDRRIALVTISIVGTKPAQISAGVMIATAFLSMWVSNTATAAMMVPIVLAVLNVVKASITEQTRETRQKEHNFAVALLLGMAYAASIGGMATVIGSPPNGIFVRFVGQTYGQTVSVLDWMLIGVPVMVILLPLTWFLLNSVLFRNQIGDIPGGKEWVRKEMKKLGAMTRGEKVVLVVFALAVSLWIFSPQIRSFTLADGTRPLKNLTDAGIAMGCGLALFALPIDFRRGVHALSWDDCKDIPWDVLLLFGGGLSMAAAIQSTGGSGLIGAQAVALANLPE
ncbi:MAG: DASS family sodium-coupled anion symporter, partial [Burkholderiaceae bacterium]|nr:DASS family sodium-coupled anion symporter [Burkholderiaceae bacterium]